MDAASSMIDKLYTRYLLRDFVAKILPGLFVLFSAAFSLEHPFAPIAFSRRLPVWGWLLLLGLAFIAGFSVQAIGEITGWTRIYNDGPSRDSKAREKAIDRMVKLQQRELPWATQQRERYVVLKEMAGNSSLALIMGIILIGLSLISSLAATIGKSIFILAAIGSFYWYNRAQAKDQSYLEEQSAKLSPRKK